MDLMLSDCHCPLSFSYECWELGNTNDNFSEHSTDDVNHKAIWKKDNKLKFVENVDEGRVQELCGEIR